MYTFNLLYVCTNKSEMTPIPILYSLFLYETRDLQMGLKKKRHVTLEGKKKMIPDSRMTQKKKRNTFVIVPK